MPTPDNAVLLAVSPNQRAIEVVYGSDVKGRGIEESAPLGVSAAAASFKDGNLMDGLISAVRVMSAGVSPALTSDHAAASTVHVGCSHVSVARVSVRIDVARQELRARRGACGAASR